MIPFPFDFPPEIAGAMDRSLIEGGDVHVEQHLDVWREEAEFRARVRIIARDANIEAEGSASNAHEACSAAYRKLAEKMLG